MPTAPPLDAPLTLDDVARLCGIEPHAVLDWLNRHGARLRPEPGEPATIAPGDLDTLLIRSGYHRHIGTVELAGPGGPMAGHVGDRWGEVGVLVGPPDARRWEGVECLPSPDSPMVVVGGGDVEVGLLGDAGFEVVDRRGRAGA